MSAASKTSARPGRAKKPPTKFAQCVMDYPISDSSSDDRYDNFGVSFDTTPAFDLQCRATDKLQVHALVLPYLYLLKTGN